MVSHCMEVARNVYRAIVDRGYEEGWILDIERDAFYSEIERGIYDDDPEFFLANLEIVFHGMGAVIDLLERVKAREAI